MLRKAQRLGRADFSTYFKVGKRYHTDTLTVVYSPLPDFHASVVVSKKVHKQAVVRNKVRRQIYAQLRAKLNQKHPGVFIVIVKPGYLKLKKDQMQGELTQTVGRILKPA